MENTSPKSLIIEDERAASRDLGWRTARWLWLLLGLFVLRVAGQMMVAFVHIRFLPSMNEWYSGLLPYPILLPVQWLIIVVFAATCSDISRGSGFFARRSIRCGTFLAYFSALYFASMGARYAFTMAIHPERRWFGTGTIPIFFHFVLAGFLCVLSRYHLTLSAQSTE